MKRDIFCLNRYNVKYVQDILKRVVDIGIKFNIRDEVVKSYDSSMLIEKVKEDVPIKGKDINLLINDFEKNFLPYCVNQSSPGYLAFPDAANSVSGLVADSFKSFINQNLIADIKSAPIGTYLEIQVIDWFRKLVGYTSNNFPKDISKVGGVVSFGGTLSNITALLVARSKVFKNSFYKGLPNNTPKSYVLTPEVVEHYSNGIALGYLGLGAENVLHIKTDSSFKMDLEDLERKIKDVLGRGDKIIAVVSYAGDSRTMNIDRFSEISTICKRYGLWFHIDACHGGALIFSDRQKTKLLGIEMADSVTIDPHKILMLPYPCSLVLFKEPSDLTTVSKNFDMTIHNNTYDLGQITPFIGSKSFESLKIWFLLKSIGIKKLGQIIDLRTKLAQNFKDFIDKNEDFVSLNDVSINGVCFLYYPYTLRNIYSNADSLTKFKIENLIDDLNKSIHDQLYRGGSVCVHTFKLCDMGNRALLKNSGKRQVLGIIIGNHNTSKEDIHKIVKLISEVASQQFKKFASSFET